MNDIIKLVLSLSLSGSILAVIIFAIKPAIKHKVSKAIQYYIWIVILLRLLIPFSFEGSAMNNVFYGGQTLWETGSQNVVLPVERASEGKVDSSIIPNVKENVANGVYNGDADHSRYFNDLFNQYALYLWFLGLVIALTANLTGYVRFSKHLKSTNKPADYEQNRMLADLLKGRKNVRLVRNPFVTTPMLMGILKPYIIIPEVNFNEKQLKNILLHELAHLKSFDIGVKWLTMIATSIHWFNPLMYFVKKEINRACELACDEAVRKKLNIAEKQAYGDTLISVVAEHKYPVAVLQATMCEEKRTLRERLLAIMKHNKKSKPIVIASIILVGIFVIGALYLGAGVGTGAENDTPQYVKGYNLSEISKYKTPYIGDNSRVSAIVNHLPAPDTYFKQRYISMETKNKPYRLKVFYEEGKGNFNGGPWPVGSPESPIYFNLQKNALILFSMIDNVDEVLFGIRFSQSEGKLEESKYDTWVAFSRSSIEELYGSPYELGRNLDSLSAALTKGNN
jgi:beta-lactamase regulating signal transducer with metallopeptidase domain